MGRVRRTGFTLIELLVVITIIAILAGILIPVLMAALRSARNADAEVLLAGLVQAIATHDTQVGSPPPGSGDGSRELAAALGKPGARGVTVLSFSAEQLTASGDIRNPAHGADAPSPIDRVHYRNNRGLKPGEARPCQPPVIRGRAFDVWCAGAAYDPRRPETAWSILKP